VTSTRRAKVAGLAMFLPRYTGASGKSPEALLFYGVVVVGVVAGACPGGGKSRRANFRVHLQSTSR
jgi:hypothetical protein